MPLERVGTTARIILKHKDNNQKLSRGHTLRVNRKVKTELNFKMILWKLVTQLIL